MARVPVYGPLKQNIGPGVTQRYTSNFSPEAYGAAQGRALQQAGNALKGIAQDFSSIQQLDDRAVVEDRSSQYRDYVRTETYDPEKGYLTQSGENAVRGQKAFDDKIEAKRKELREGMTPAQQKAFDEKARARQHTSKDTSIRHAANQRKVWYNDVSTAKLNGLSDDALAFAEEPEKFGETIAEGEIEIAERGSMLGWAPEKLAHEQEQWRSQVHSNMIRRIAPENPIAAKAWLDTHRERMSNVDVANLEKVLTGPVRTENAKRLAAQITQGELVDEDPDAPKHSDTGLDAPEGELPEIEALQQQGREDRANGNGIGDLTKSKKSSLKTNARDGVASASAMLRHYEGFSPKTYWDVNHHRAGYGSDTITDKNGNVRTTRKGDKVSRADAERDLARRAGIVNVDMKNRYGAAWDKLTPDARGALISVVYNYGRVPAGVSNAIKTGNVSQIATAVDALSGHNGGVNARRRGAEANSIRGGKLPKGATLQQEHQPRYAVQLDKIKDPKLRAATADQISKIYAAKDKMVKYKKRAFKIDVEKFIIRNPDFEPTKLPLSYIEGLGTEGMTMLTRYHDMIQKRGDITTDEQLFAKLQRQQAEDPNGFAEDIDLFDHIDKLSTKDRRALQKLQIDAIKDKREKSDKSLTQGRSLASAMSIANIRLKEAGIIKKNPGAETLKRQAAFQRAIVERMQEFQKLEKREPTDYEISEMVDVALTPIILTENDDFEFFSPDTWRDSSRDGFVFDARTRKPGETVELNISYESIPVQVRLQIKKELVIDNGTPPTEAEIIAEYAKMVLGLAPKKE